MPSRFATVAHTGHAAGPGAPDCISCHMPARTYMVVDRRHDHSFRIPRPDVSVQFGTPNACNACHTDKSAAWAADAVQRWHGPQREGLQNWTQAFHRARAGDPAARALLLALAGDPSVPAIARATAIGEMQRFASAATQDATARALNDADPLVRIAALHGEEAAPLDQRWQLANGLLSDPVAAVRQEAGALLAGQPPQALSATDRARLADAGAAYAAAQRLNADRPEGRAGLADFLRRSGDATGAEAELRAGLRADPSSVLLSVNLADLYRALGRDQDAAAVLRQVLALAPQSAAAHHALGLTLIRLKDTGAALAQLGQAAALAPEDARFAYVDAVALQSTGDIDAARRVANAALLRHPYDAALLNWALRDAAGAGDSARAAALGRALAVVEQ
jgi:Tfp pilus assembly protein PilF